MKKKRKKNEKNVRNIEWQMKQGKEWADYIYKKECCLLLLLPLNFHF